MKRRTPIRHKVRAHTRKGKYVTSFMRGSGKNSQTTKRVVVKERKRLPSGVHTGGIKKLDGKVAKPLLGRNYAIDDTFTTSPTKEYDAIKALEDLKHIPKGVEITEIEGVPHMIRNDLYILEDEDYQRLKKEDLISIEKTIREANRRGWVINDNIQLGFDAKQRELVIYDWSAAWYYDDPKWADDDPVICRLWEEAGRGDYIKARHWGRKKRLAFNVLQGKYTHPYTYMSYARPPSHTWMELPEGSEIEHITMDERWKPMGLIHSKVPLSDEKISKYELTLVEYR